MKKSSQVPASFIIALSASLTTAGCASYDQQCQDSWGRVLPDSACRGGAYPGARWIRIQRGGFGGSGGSGGGGWGGVFGG